MTGAESSSTRKLSAAEEYSAALSWVAIALPPSWSTKYWADGPMGWILYSATETPSQGWKIHISASAYETPNMLRKVVPILIAANAAFKVPRSVFDIIFLNSGDAGFEQLGKILTVYPHDQDMVRDLLIAIDLAWPHSKGPEICSDLHIRPHSAVSFRFGVFSPGPILIDSIGRYAYALSYTDGNLGADVRRRDGSQPPGFALPLNGYPPSLCPFQSKDSITVENRTFVLLSIINETPQSIVYLAADTADFNTAVIKVVRPGVGGDRLGQDCSDLLDNEFHVLSALAPSGIAPKPLGWYSGTWPALIMEDLRGECLSELPRKERIAALPLLADAIGRIHLAGFVHSDIKLENAIILKDRVFLIDFELTTQVGREARRGGTLGHLPPEVGNGYRNIPARDVYALGGCLFQAIMDIPPGLFVANQSCLANLLRNENALAAAELFEWLTNFDPEVRPTANVAAKALKNLAEEIDTHSSSVLARSPDIDWCQSTSLDAARAANLFAEHGEEGSRWRNMHFQRSFYCEALNIGSAGILLGLMSIDAAVGKREFEREIENGARWLANASPEGKAPGLFTGNAGVALTLALAARQFDNIHYATAARDRLFIAEKDRRELDFFSGSAGVLFACCLISKLTCESWPIELAARLAHQLLNTVSRRGGIPVWSLEGEITTDYLGCAHGSSGFALALATYGHAACNPKATALARETFTAIHHLGTTPMGALRMTCQSDRHHAVGNWCHGVAGYLWAILQGLGDDPALRQEIDWAVECLSNAPTIGTPTYCHGLAGQLELWCMLREIPRFNALANMQADKVVNALKILSQEMHGHYVWASDNPDIVTPDLWIGFLGPATALALYAANSPSALLSPKWLALCTQS